MRLRSRASSYLFLFFANVDAYHESGAGRGHPDIYMLPIKQ